MNNYLVAPARTAEGVAFLSSPDQACDLQTLKPLQPTQLANESSSLRSRRLAKLSVLTILVFLLAACGNTGKRAGVLPYSQANFLAPPTPATAVATSSAGSDTQSPTLSGLLDNPQDVLCAADPAVVQQALLQLVNESRKESRNCGRKKFAPVAAVTLQATLQSIANNHSLDMASNNFFSHTGSDGLTVLERAVTAGYNWQHISENIAAGHVTTGEVHAGWLKSPGHCVNIMAAEVTEFGAACITNDSSENKRYWSTAFGRQRDSL